MAKFAIYYVPRAEDEIYRLGSELLGYDVRARKPIVLSEEMEKRFQTIGGYSEEWGRFARPYGFHMAIGDTIEFHLADLVSIENELDDLLNCFNPRHPFELWRVEDAEFVALRPGPHGQAVALRYRPNEALWVLHTLVVARLHTRGVGTAYLQRLLRDPTPFKDQPFQAHRIRKFFSPAVLDGYKPHFTVLNPYTGKRGEELAELLLEQFGKFTKIRINSICLMLQVSDDENFQIHREYECSQYPRPIVK